MQKVKTTTQAQRDVVSVSEEQNSIITTVSTTQW